MKYHRVIDDDKLSLHVEEHEHEGERLFFLHLGINEWSKDLFKQYKREFEDIKKEFKSNGIPTLFCFITKDKEKEHLVKMFGFEELDETEEGKLMGQEI